MTCLTAVIVTYNSAHVVTDLLDSIPPAAEDLEVEVVVVDNGSVDTSLEVLKWRQDCSVIRSSNEGYAAGLMKGILSAKSEGPILVLNPDVRLAPKSITAMLAALHDRDVGIVVPKILTQEGDLFLSLRREPSILRAVGLNRTKASVFSEYVTEPVAYEQPGIVDWALGAVMLITRECLDATGGWDPSYFLYSEETDFCLRARDLGYVTRYEPNALAVHIGGQSGRSGETHTMQIVNRVRLYRRRHGSVASWVYFALNVLSELSWIARGNERSRSAFLALVSPRRRPTALKCGERLMPS